jgi:hypothetical protein
VSAGELAGLKVGDTIVVVRPTSSRRGAPPIVSEEVISVVGRVYVTTAGWEKRQFAIDDGFGKGDFIPGRAYRSMASYEAEKARRALEERAQRALQQLSVRDWPAEKLQALLALVDGGAP